MLHLCRQLQLIRKEAVDLIKPFLAVGRRKHCIDRNDPLLFRIIKMIHQDPVSTDSGLKRPPARCIDPVGIMHISRPVQTAEDGNLISRYIVQIVSKFACHQRQIRGKGNMELKIRPFL